MPKFHRYGNKVRNAIFFGFLTSVCIFLFILGELKESFIMTKVGKSKKNSTLYTVQPPETPSLSMPFFGATSYPQPFCFILHRVSLFSV